MERPMQKLNDLNRSLIALEQDRTLIAVIEMSLSSWLVGGIVPGVERQPVKKLAVDEEASASMARGSRKGRTQDHTHRCRLRSPALFIALPQHKDFTNVSARWVHGVKASNLLVRAL
jgi:transposase